MTGRPTKLSPDLQRSIINAIIEGAPIDIAAKANGVTPSAVHEWQHRGRAILAGECQAKASPLEVDCPSCTATIGTPCHNLQRPDRLIQPHKTRRLIASDPAEGQRYVDFAEAMEGAAATGVILDLRTVGIASRPRRVTRTTTKSFPVKVRGEVQLDPAGRPIMVTETTTTEWDEVDAKPAQWRLAKRLPDRFGERVTTALEGHLAVSAPAARTEEDSDARDAAIVAALMESGELDAWLAGATDTGDEGGAATSAEAASAEPVLPVPAEPEAGGVPAAGDA